MYMYAHLYIKEPFQNKYKDVGMAMPKKFKQGVGCKTHPYILP